MPTLRLLSVDARASGRDRAALVSAISAADADAICVHNGPRLGRWRAHTAVIARGTGRVVVSAGGRGSGANSILSTLGVDSAVSREVRLPGGTNLKPPGAAVAVLRAHGTEFVLASATLIGNASERLGQVGELQRVIRSVIPGDPPVVISALGADRPGTAAWQSLAGNRVAVVGRLFVDERIDVHDARELDGAVPAVLAQLVL